MSYLATKNIVCHLDDYIYNYSNMELVSGWNLVVQDINVEKQEGSKNLVLVCELSKTEEKGWHSS